MPAGATQLDMNTSAQTNYAPMREFIASQSQSLIPFLYIKTLVIFGSEFAKLVQQEIDHNKITETSLPEQFKYKLGEYRGVIEYGKFVYREQEIDFNSNSWKLKADKNDEDNVANTIIFDGNYDVIVKCFIYHLTRTTTNAPATLVTKANVAADVLDYFSKNYYVFDEISIQKLAESYSDKAFARQLTIREFLEFLKHELNVQVGNTDILSTYIETKRNEHSKQQYKLLPFEFYNKLCKALKGQVHDTSVSDINRIKAAMLYVIAETGIRISEACKLHYDCIAYPRKDYPNQPWLKYEASKGRGKKTTYYMPIPEELKKEILYIRDICKEMAENENVLFPNTTSRNRTYHTFESTIIEYYLTEFCIKHADELDLKNRPDGDKYFKRVDKDCSSLKLGQKNIYRLDSQTVNDILGGTVYYYPTAHQFRVFCITQKANGGVSIPELSITYSQKYQYSPDIYYRGIRPDQDSIVVTKMGRNEANASKEVHDAKMSADDIKPSTYKDIKTMIDDQTGLESIESVNGGYCVSDIDEDCEALDPKSFTLPAMYMGNRIITKELLPLLKRDIESIIAIIEYNEDNGFVKQNNREKKKLKLMADAMASSLSDETLTKHETESYSKWLNEVLKDVR